MKSISELALLPSPRLTYWLNVKNVGETLRTIHPNLSLRVLAESFEPDWVRHIFLEVAGEPLVYGRVDVSQAVYQKYKQAFHSLGTRLIGETLLYNNPKTHRDPFEYAIIENAHPLFEFIARSLPPHFQLPQRFWARRSLFHMNGVDPLQITEVFLDCHSLQSTPHPRLPPQG